MKSTRWPATIFLVAWSVGTATVGAQPAPLVEPGAMWRYLDDGSDQGTGWRDSGFDDSGWPAGPAELGYGDGDEATVVGYGPDENNKYTTTYFRHAFDVADPSEYSELALNVLYDDGCVVYLNGTEIARINMPGIPGQDDIDFATFASGTVEETWQGVPVDPGILLVGSNLLAVEMHQVSLTSSDISFDLALGPPPPPLLRKGPYLIYEGVDTQMTVLWQLDDTETCTLEWGRDVAYAAGWVQTVEFGGDHQHKYVMDNLEPGARYFYRVTDENNAAYLGSFLAAPADDAPAVKFFGYGDTRSDPVAHDRVCEGMVDRYQGDGAFQTLLLHSGDFTYDDSESAWTNEYFNPMSLHARTLQSDMPIQGAVGNHEAAGTNYRKYWPYPYVSDFYWSFDYGPVHVSVIDQYVSYSPGSAQYVWLENDLAQSSSCWKILVLHEPGWSAGGHENNPDVQDYLQPLCLTYGVSVVLCGHNHYYARCDVNGVQHITSGGGGAPPYACDPGYPNVVTCQSVYHYCELAVDDETLTFRAVDVDGNELDRFTLSCASDVDVAGRTVDDDACAFGGPGNQDGLVDPGEVITLSVTLENRGADAASGIQAVLSSTTAGVSFAPGQDTASYPDLAPGESASGDTPFAFVTDPAVVGCGQTLDFTVGFTYTTSLGTRTETERFNLDIPALCHVCGAPELSVESVTLIADSCAYGGGDDNGRVEPGEDAFIRVRLRNDGLVDATNITAVLSSTASVAITQDRAALAALGPLAQDDLAPDFEFHVDSATPCGTVLDFTLELTYAEGTAAAGFSMSIPDPCVECLEPGCRLGVPDRIGDLMLVRRGMDVELSWALDPKAEGGYDLYMSDAKEDIPFLRLESPPPIPDPFLTAGPAGPMPLTYPGGVNDGLLYYQALGVCHDGVTEGPN